MIHEKIVTAVVHFRQMEEMEHARGMLGEVRSQFADMASGGDGGELGFEENGETSCRGINYKEMPDLFFQEVIDLMGW
jgi:hypothetical protein